VVAVVVSELDVSLDDDDELLLLLAPPPPHWPPPPRPGPSA
jgi:hypothetical protein